MTALQKELLAGRFEIRREVGRGAAGVVFRAIDVVSAESAALKVIATGHDAEEDQNRFLREGEVLAKLTHPNVVRVLGYGALDGGYADAAGRKFPAGTAYVAMEWLEGEDLAVRQRASPLTLPVALDVIRQTADALAFAHDAGIVHRDIKPSNIFLAYPSRPKEGKTSGLSTLRGGDPIDDGLAAADNNVIVAKILDFGVAAAGDMSGAGAIVGTPAYMSPEQAQGVGAPDARSDIYSLGATLFELVAGRPPHAAPTSIATLARRVTGPAPRLGELMLDVPERLDALVAHLLEAEPDARPRSARDVSRAIADLSGDPAVARATRLTLREDDTRARVGTRLVTTVVALGVTTGEDRQRVIARIREFGADALPLGADSSRAKPKTARSPSTSRRASCHAGGSSSTSPAWARAPSSPTESCVAATPRARRSSAARPSCSRLSAPTIAAPTTARRWSSASRARPASERAASDKR